MSEYVKLSVIIPTLNRYEDLRNTIQYLNGQSFDEFEIIVVDQTEDPQREDDVKASPRVRYIHEKEKSASRARNIGLKNARSDYVLFLDDDVILENENYLTNIVAALESGCPGVVGPIVDAHNRVLRKDRHRWSENTAWGWLFFPRNYAQSCKINDGGAGNLAVRRDWAIEIGGMDEQYVKGAHREESDFNQRYTRKYGWYCYLPGAALVHIGSRQGGVRSWDNIKSKAVKAQHHFDGSFYFLLSHVRWYHWPPHLLSMVIFFFYRKEFLRRPDWLLLVNWRFFKGFFNGIKMRRQGPKYMSIENRITH